MWMGFGRAATSCVDCGASGGEAMGEVGVSRSGRVEHPTGRWGGSLGSKIFWGSLGSDPPNDPQNIPWKFPKKQKTKQKKTKKTKTKTSNDCLEIPERSRSHV
jgi:hypothetical protein